MPKQQADILYRAAQNFLGTPEEQIGNTLKDIIQAHQRAVIGAMSIEVGSDMSSGGRCYSRVS